RGTYRIHTAPPTGKDSYRDDTAIRATRSHGLLKIEGERQKVKGRRQRRRRHDGGAVPRDRSDVADDGDRGRVAARAGAEDPDLPAVLTGDQRGILRAGRAREDRIALHEHGAPPPRQPPPDACGFGQARAGKSPRRGGERWRFPDT